MKQTPESTTEARLVSEFSRTSQRPLVPAPSLAQMAATVASRRRRNRLMAGAAALAAVAGVGLGAASLVGGGDSGTEVVAAETEQASATQAQPGEADATQSTVVAAADPALADTSETEAPAATVEPDQGPVVSAPVEESIEDVSLQPASDELAVETRPSAVGFAGGSGVLLLPTDDGFIGLASRFGGPNGVTAIGLRSENGLDWEEVELAGVPAGATATSLRYHDARYFALFAGFDVESQRNNVWVGVSDDVILWEVGLLEGENPIASDLAIGPAGVMAVGVAPDHRTWVGPIGGPYVETAPINMLSLAGVVAVEDGFAAAGTTGDGPAIQSSADGAEWTTAAVSGFDGDTLNTFTVAGDATVLTGDDGDTRWVARSIDGGQSWQRSALGDGTMGTVATGGETVAVFGSGALGADTLSLSGGDRLASVALDIAAPDRVQLLAVSDDAAVLLATVDGELTWIRASR